MVAIISLLLIIAFALLIIRVGTVALTMTGLSEEVAAFQSLSAFTGTGFTTQETESVVATPTRRRIVRHLVILGHAGVITAMSSLVLSFSGAAEQAPLRLAMMAAGVVLIVLIAHSRWFRKVITPTIRRLLSRRSMVALQDYAELLGLQDGYSVVEVLLHEDAWITGDTLRKLRLTDEGVLILGIVRADGIFIGAPSPEAIGKAGDTMIMYGPEDEIQSLASRKKGDQEARDRAVAQFMAARETLESK